MSRAKGRPRHVGSDLTDSGRLWYTGIAHNFKTAIPYVCHVTSHDPCTGDVKTDAGAGAGALPHDLSSYLCTEESLKGSVTTSCI